MKALINKLIALVICVLTFSSCSFEDEAEVIYGHPTRIATGETPIDTLCRIQAEFRELPKPLMHKMSYVPAWTSRKFGAAPVKYDGYHKIELTPAGLEFLQKHSRLELVISLTPLFAEEGIGGEAAVLLAGIPAGDKSSQRGKTAKIAKALKDTRYKSPNSPGSWFEKPQHYYARVNTLSGLGNKTESISQSKPQNLNQSLEQKIIDELYLYGHSPLKLFEQHPYMPQPHNEDLVKKWIEENKAPTLIPAAQEYISRNSELASLVLFPFLPGPGRSVLSRNDILMMYLLGVEEHYWPAIMQLSSGKKLINQLRQEYQQVMYENITAVCDT